MNVNIPNDRAARWEWLRRTSGFFLMATATAANASAIVAILLFPDYSLTALLFIVPLVFVLGVALSGTGAQTPHESNVAWLKLEVRNMLYYLAGSCLAAMAKSTYILLALGSIVDMAACCLYMLASIHCAKYFNRSVAARASRAKGLVNIPV